MRSDRRTVLKQARDRAALTLFSRRNHLAHLSRRDDPFQMRAATWHRFQGAMHQRTAARLYALEPERVPRASGLVRNRSSWQICEMAEAH
jgi:hypothetical protein